MSYFTNKIPQKEWEELMESPASMNQLSNLLSLASNNLYETVNKLGGSELLYNALQGMTTRRYREIRNLFWGQDISLANTAITELMVDYNVNKSKEK